MSARDESSQAQGRRSSVAPLVPSLTVFPGLEGWRLFPRGSRGTHRRGGLRLWRRFAGGQSWSRDGLRPGGGRGDGWQELLDESIHVVQAARLALETDHGL